MSFASIFIWNIQCKLKRVNYTFTVLHVSHNTHTFDNTPDDSLKGKIGRENAAENFSGMCT